MFNVSDYLARFKHLLTSEKFLKEGVVSIVKEYTQIELPIDAVTIRSGVAKLDVSPAVRAAIFIKKEAILISLKKELGNKVADIQ